jgi:beta-lactamase regulating signal transducer with metallopeptidase domain
MPHFEGMDPTLFAVASVLVKVTLVLGLAAVASLALSRSSAAARHAVWTIAVGALFALPVAQVLLPQLHVPGWIRTEPALDRPASSTDPAGLPHLEETGALVVTRPGSSVNGTENRTAPSPADRPVDPLQIAGLVWSVGAALVLLRVWMDRRSLRRVEREALETNDAEWTTLIAGIAERLRVRRPVRLLCGPPGTAPMTWGTLRPVVLLPRDAETWSNEDRTAVLLHEVSHVKRLDCLTQDLSWIACTIYWFHPAVWLAAHRMRVERERACDDLVLESGTTASKYAAQLIRVVRSTRPFGSWLGAPAPSTADRSRLEERIRAILDGNVDRRAPRARFRVAVLGIALGIALPLAALAPAQVPPAGAMEEGASAPSKEPYPGPTSVPGPGSSLESKWTRAVASARGKSVWIAFGISLPPTKETYWSDSEGRHFDEIGRGGRTLAEKYGFKDSDAVFLFRIPRERSSADVPFDRIAIRSGSLAHEDGGIEVVSIGTPGAQESFDLILGFFEKLPDDPRARVTVTALSLHQVDEATPVLLRILEGKRSEEVRAQAAEGLARHPGPRALQSLVAHARADRAQQVRREAAEAVGDIPYEPATDALIDLARTLDDEQVRAEAVESLAMRPVKQVLPVLVALSGEDPSESVRCEAVETLGDLPDRAGLPALRRIVRDSPSERVRNEAFETLNDMAERSKREAARE